MGLRLDYIWRHSAFKQSAELRNIRAARGIVDGCHDQRALTRSQVLRQALFDELSQLWGSYDAGSRRARLLASCKTLATLAS